MMKSLNHTALDMVTVDTFPPILHPHLSSVLKSGMIKSRFIESVTRKSLQSSSKPNRFGGRVCWGCPNVCATRVRIQCGRQEEI